MSRFKSIGEDLEQEWVKLENRWWETRRLWQDSVARRFEKSVWEELEGEIPRAVRSLHELDQILDKAELKTSN